jgi:hypothetical protein
MGNENQPVRFGGSFAPPIDAAAVSRYRALADHAGNPATTEYMRKLCDMVDLFHATPASKRPGKPHPSGRGVITPLEAAEVDRIFEAVPWPHELDMMGVVFEQLDPISQRDVRNAAFHLLWYGRELCLDREPITTDRL